MKDTETRRQYKNDGGAADRADISRSGANPDDSSRSDAHAARGGRDGKRTVSRGAMIAVVSVLGALTLLLGGLYLISRSRRKRPRIRLRASAKVRSNPNATRCVPSLTAYS